MAACDNRTYSVSIDDVYLFLTIASTLYKFRRDAVELSIDAEGELLTVKGLTDKGEYKSLALYGMKPWTFWQDDLPGADFRWSQVVNDDNTVESYEVSESFAKLVWAIEYATYQRADGVKASTTGSGVISTDTMAKDLMFRSRHWGEGWPAILTPQGRGFNPIWDLTPDVGVFLRDSAGSTAPSSVRSSAHRMIRYEGRLEWYAVITGYLVRFWSDTPHPMIEGNYLPFMGDAANLQYEVLVGLPTGLTQPTYIMRVYKAASGDTKPSFWLAYSASHNGIAFQSLKWNEGGGQYDAIVSVSDPAGGFTEASFVPFPRRMPNGDLMAGLPKASGVNVAYWKYNSGDPDLPASYTIKDVLDGANTGNTARSGLATDVNLLPWYGVGCVPIERNGHYQFLVLANGGGQTDLAICYHNGGSDGTESNNWTVETVYEDFGNDPLFASPEQMGDGLNDEYALLLSESLTRTAVVDFKNFLVKDYAKPGAWTHKQAEHRFIPGGNWRNDGPHFFARRWLAFTPYTGTAQLL